MRGIEVIGGVDGGYAVRVKQGHVLAVPVLVHIQAEVEVVLREGQAPSRCDILARGALLRVCKEEDKRSHHNQVEERGHLSVSQLAEDTS